MLQITVIGNYYLCWFINCFMSMTRRCGNVAAILRLDLVMTRDFIIFSDVRREKRLLFIRVYAFYRRARVGLQIEQLFHISYSVFSHEEF